MSSKNKTSITKPNEAMKKNNISSSISNKSQSMVKSKQSTSIPNKSVTPATSSSSSSSKEKKDADEDDLDDIFGGGKKKQVKEGENLKKRKSRDEGEVKEDGESESEGEEEGEEYDSDNSEMEKESEDDEAPTEAKLATLRRIRRKLEEDDKKKTGSNVKVLQAGSSQRERPDDDFGFTRGGNARGIARTAEGFKVYQIDDLKMGKGKDTPLCPIDCDCCF